MISAPATELQGRGLIFQPTLLGPRCFLHSAATPIVHTPAALLGAFSCNLGMGTDNIQRLNQKKTGAQEAVARRTGFKRNNGSFGSRFIKE